MHTTAKLCLLLCSSLSLLLSQATARTRVSASSVETARRAAIQRSIAALERDCATHGGGDWHRWYELLAPFRAEMRARIEAGAKGLGTPNYLVEMSGEPLLFERSDELEYLAGPENLDAWITQRAAIPAITKVTQWLRKQGIDVILVPVPRTIELYPDRVTKDPPPGGIAAPQIKKLQLDLLRADVEVIDLLPELLAARTQNPESLSLSDDPHWGPAGQDVAARLIVERLSRYPFVQRALTRPPLFHEKPVARSVTGGWHRWLTVDQRQRLADSTQVMGTQIFDGQNKEFQPVAASPVVLMGDSFCTSMNYLVAPGSALDAQISKRINLPITVWMVAGGTLQSIKDTLRDPDLLKDRKVIIWLLQDPSVCNPTAWTLPPLPNPAPVK